MNPVLVIDIGNTSTSFGLYSAGRLHRVRRMDTPRCTEKSIAAALRGFDSDSAVIASVVPKVNRIWNAAVKRSVLWASAKVNLGIPVTYPKPETIGADRLANACGGVHKYGAPLIVADFGTAVTFDVVTKRQGYVGGVIAPGLPLMFSYLAEKTAKLPLIKPGPTPGHIGKNTREAMMLGARWGYRGMVREILSELTRNSELANAKLVATGGYADWVVRGLKPLVARSTRDEPRMIVDQSLTLYGLGKIYELNS